MQVSLGKTSYYGIKTRVLFSSGALLFNICYFLCLGIKTKAEKKHFYAWKESDFKNVGDDGIRWGAILVVLLDTCANVVGGISVIFSMRAAIVSQINQGVMSSLYSLTSVLMAFVGVCMFNEKLKIYHWVGVGLMFICAVLIGSANGDAGQP